MNHRKRPGEMKVTGSMVQFDKWPDEEVGGRGYESPESGICGGMLGRVL